MGGDEADGVIHGLHHAAVDGAVLDLADGEDAVVFEAFIGEPGGGCFLAVFFPEVGRGLDGAVDGVEGEEGEEGFFGFLLNEIDGFSGEADGEGFAVGAVLELGVIVRGEVAAAWGAGMITAFVDFEAVVFGAGAFAAEVPLSGEEGAISA